MSFIFIFLISHLLINESFSLFLLFNKSLSTFLLFNESSFIFVSPRGINLKLKNTFSLVEKKVTFNHERKLSFLEGSVFLISPSTLPLSCLLLPYSSFPSKFSSIKQT